MAEIKKARIFLRRGTDTSRLGTELCEGELGYSTDGTRVFVGDGSTLGGNSLGTTVFLLPATSATNPVADPFTSVTTLTAVTANGRAEVGDMAFVPASSYNLKDFNLEIDAGDAENVTSTPKSTFGTLYVLSARDGGTGDLTWTVANSGIPVSHLDIPDNSIAANKIHGGDISGELTFSDDITSLSAVTLSGVADAAPQETGVVELSSGVVYPLGITHTSLVTAASSIFDLGYYAQRGLSNFIPCNTNDAFLLNGSNGTSIGSVDVESWANTPSSTNVRSNTTAFKYKDITLSDLLNVVDTNVYGTFLWEQIDEFHFQSFGKVGESAGWTLGYTNNAANRNVVLHHHVHGVASDKKADENPFHQAHIVPNAWTVAAPASISGWPDGKRLRFYLGSKSSTVRAYLIGVKIRR